MVPDPNDSAYNPCLHAGTYMNTPCGGVDCSCLPGFSGRLCEKYVGGGGTGGGTGTGGTAGGGTGEVFIGDVDNESSGPSSN